MQTEAVVLHAFDYLESSRILRLATRDAGILSVVARGARRPRNSFGTLDLFVQGCATVSVRPNRDLHTLTGFDLVRYRISLGHHLDRFVAAAVLAELVMRFADEDSSPDLFPILVRGLDELEADTLGDATEIALGAAWQLIRGLGFAPVVDTCATCHEAIAHAVAAAFDRRAGGVLCVRCAAPRDDVRPIPARARAALRSWLDGRAHPLGTHGERRAHQRLLRQFLMEHVADERGRGLKAFEAWERRVRSRAPERVP
ncbi:MAG: DNA repair protein RecO [Gemmatimonadaceae bacterium]